MRFSDLLRLALANLGRRKLRTSLTVLGVIIGCASIVVMLSIAAGQEQMLLKQIESSRGLTEIDVSSYKDPNKKPSGPGSNGLTKEGTGLTDKGIEELKSWSKVKKVYPVLNHYMNAKTATGSEAYLNLIAYPYEYIKDLKLDFLKGAFPKPGTSPRSILPLSAGKDVQEQFYDPHGKNGGAYEYDDFFGKETSSEKVDLYNEAIFVTVQEAREENGVTIPPKKYLVQVDAIHDTKTDFELKSGLITEIEAFKAFMNQAYKGKAWPNQPSNKDGKAIGAINYNSLKVISNSIEDTEALLKDLRAAGYECNSNLEFVKSMRENMRTMQLVLGGIGGVAFLVAAIGIANTMMMSIYERTKEIGIFKVLGCRLRDISYLFLLESAFIGFIGGVLGVIISSGISMLINNIANSGGGFEFAEAAEEVRKISVISPQLAIMAIVFSTLIGTISGLIPAIRAMKLSPLNALRTE